MLHFNLRRIFEIRGITRPYSFLVENGFAENTATRLINGKVHGLNLHFVEKLCILMKCTPNDLLTWTPGTNIVLPDDLPLKELERDNAVADFRKLSATLPLQELERIMAQIKEYKKEEKKEQ